MTPDIRIPYRDTQDQRQASRSGAGWPRHRSRRRAARRSRIRRDKDMTR